MHLNSKIETLNSEIFLLIVTSDLAIRERSLYCVYSIAYIQGIE